MKIRVSIKDRSLEIEVGSGLQSLSWLANCALIRYDPSLSLDLGLPMAIRSEQGEALQFQSLIREKLSDGSSIIVMLTKEGEENQAEDEQEKKQKNQTEQK
jgi:hypothetical protein